MDHKIMVMLKTISESIRKQRDNDLKKIGLTFAQARVLLFVADKNGKTTQKEIEHNLLVSHSATHGIINRLEEKGCIECSSNRADKRQKQLNITDSGLSKVNYIMNIIKNKDLSPISVLTNNEKECLNQILSKIIEKLSK